MEKDEEKADDPADYYGSGVGSRRSGLYEYAGEQHG